MREASGNLQGVELRCILNAWTASGRKFEGARNWEEFEYCIDSKSGLLATYSPVPGLYVHYDYTNAFHFHGKIVPGAFTISEAGRIILEAKTESVTDPVTSNNAPFDPSGLRALGVGSVMQPPVWVRGAINAPERHGWTGIGSPLAESNADAINAAPPDANRTMRMVIVHGIVSPEGQVVETEILASTDASLNQRALDRANAWKTGRTGSDMQPGTTPQSREIIFTFQDVNPPM